LVPDLLEYQRLKPEVAYHNSQRVTATTAVSYSFTAVAAPGRWQADSGREPLSHTESTDAEHKTFVSRPLSRSGGIDHTEHTYEGSSWRCRYAARRGSLA
jgi:hypothetical protein